jgi:hypothetical protein
MQHQDTTAMMNICLLGQGKCAEGESVQENVQRAPACRPPAASRTRQRRCPRTACAPAALCTSWCRRWRRLPPRSPACLRLSAHHRARAVAPTPTANPGTMVVTATLAHVWRSTHQCTCGHMHAVAAGCGMAAVPGGMQWQQPAVSLGCLALCALMRWRHGGRAPRLHARRVDVHEDGLIRVVVLQVQQLGEHELRHRGDQGHALRRARRPRDNGTP